MELNEKKNDEKEKEESINKNARYSSIAFLVAATIIAGIDLATDNFSSQASIQLMVFLVVSRAIFFYKTKKKYIYFYWFYLQLHL